jgi:hypothetical protein
MIRARAAALKEKARGTVQTAIPSAVSRLGICEGKLRKIHFEMAENHTKRPFVAFRLPKLIDSEVGVLSPHLLKKTAPNGRIALNI